MHYFKVLFIKSMKGKKTDRKSANFEFLIKKKQIHDENLCASASS